MTMRAAAAKVAEAARWTPTLSMDEPMVAVAPWRLFCAVGWHQSAAAEALDPPLPAPHPSPTPAEEPTP